MDYKTLSSTIVKELSEVFNRLNEDEINKFIKEITSAKKIILIGCGREGLSTRAFAMRLMHLGLNAHWAWDDTTPSLGEGDLLLATSGCGEVGQIHYVVERAKKNGARVAVVTGDPDKKTLKLADSILFVPASVYLGSADVVSSVQLMGNLFEQSILIVFDMIAMDLAQRLGRSKEDMEKNHRNIE